jgi:hypothetical protein
LLMWNVTKINSEKVIKRKIRILEDSLCP